MPRQVVFNVLPVAMFVSLPKVRRREMLILSLLTIESLRARETYELRPWLQGMLDKIWAHDGREAELQYLCFWLTDKA